MSYVTGCIATFFGSLCRFTIFFTEIAIFKSLSAGGMPPVPQVAQQISQEEKQQQNGPNLSSLLNSLPAPHSRNPALPQQAGIRTMCLWSQRQFPHNSRYHICILACMGSVDLCLLCGDFVDGRNFYSSLGRKEKIIPVVIADDFAKPDNLLRITQLGMDLSLQ